MVDTGRVEVCYPPNLLHLPDQFRSFPYQAIDIRLMGVVPFDFDDNWSSISTDTVKRWLFKTRECYLQGNILFSLKYTIYVKSIVFVESLETVSTEVNTFDVKQAIVKKMFGVIDKRPTESLLQMAKDCGLVAERVIVKTVAYNELIVPLTKEDTTVVETIIEESSPAKIVKPKTPVEKWTSFQENHMHKLFIGIFNSPGQFFIQDFAHVDEIANLRKKIAEFVSNASNLTPIVGPAVGDLCLVNCEGLFQRGKISKVDPDGCEVFLCDVGVVEVFSAPYQIPNILIQAAPFQVSSMSQFLLNV